MTNNNISSENDDADNEKFGRQWSPGAAIYKMSPTQDGDKL